MEDEDEDEFAVQEPGTAPALLGIAAIAAIVGALFLGVVVLCCAGILS